MTIVHPCVAHLRRVVIAVLPVVVLLTGCASAVPHPTIDGTDDGTGLQEDLVTYSFENPGELVLEAVHGPNSVAPVPIEIRFVCND